MAAPCQKRTQKPFILQLSLRSIVVPVQHILVVQQARRATTALNSLLWSKYISVNTKKRIFYSDRKHFKLRLGIMDTGLQVKEKMLSREMKFWKWTTKISKLLKGMRSSEKKHRKQMAKTNNDLVTGRKMMVTMIWSGKRKLTGLWSRGI
jgi:hypothetical protein